MTTVSRVNSSFNTTANPSGARGRARLSGFIRLLAAVGVLAMLAGCSIYRDWRVGADDPKLDGNCVRDVKHGPTARVINYADPELCDRDVAHRGPDHVRTAPVPFSASQQEQ
jgi:hypothetical protein